jgi:hypothetical protein
MDRRRQSSVLPVRLLKFLEDLNRETSVQPIADGIQRARRERFLDRRIFVRQAGRAGLEQMIQACKLDNLEIRMPAISGRASWQ